MCSFIPSATVSVSKIDILRGLLCSITCDGRPFCHIEDGMFKYGFQPILSKLPVHYNRHNIVGLLDEAALYVRAKMTKVLQNTMSSVKVDGVTRFSRSFLGINVQVSRRINILPRIEKIH